MEWGKNAETELLSGLVVALIILMLAVNPLWVGKKPLWLIL